MFELGGNFTSTSSSSFVDPKQQPFLDFLRNSGQGLIQAGGIQNAQNWGQEQSQALYGQGQQFMSGLQNNPFMSALQGQAGGNPGLVQAQTNQLGQDLGRQFNQQVLPGIGRESVGIGAFGGSRQGVAEGMAAQGFADAFGRGAVGFQEADAQRSLQAGQAGAGINAQSMLGGLQAQQGLYDIGMGQFMGGFAPLFAQSGLVGGPTVLDKSSSKSVGLNGGMG